MFDFTMLQPEDIKILETLVPSATRYAYSGRNPLLGLRPGDGIKACDATHLRAHFRPWDLQIAPDGSAYIFRWHLIPRNAVGANVYLHLQVADDPERPLHDHPWDNTSVILAGGYREVYVTGQGEGYRLERVREVRKGDVVHRKAEEAHRIFLLPDTPYTISLFTTGPVRRDWGFWFEDPQRWVSHPEVIEETADGRSVFKGRPQ
jgi:quercetin dioxygenase-like cupin family protein